jgi:hypothetical protein
MAFKFLPEKRALSGDEMLPHWALRNFDMVGDSIVSFVGDFKVPPERWVDISGIMRGGVFPNSEMMHIVVEHFGCALPEAVLRQYVLVSILQEKLLHRIKTNGHNLTRLGDDLFDGDKRLSITAVGSTLVSAKIHIGVFTESPGMGYFGLTEYGVDPKELAEVVVCQYCAEMRRLAEKAWKVKPII